MEEKSSNSPMRLILIVFGAALLAVLINSLIWFSIEENREAGRGEYYLAKGLFAEAEHDLTLAVAKHPADSKLRLELGEAQLRGGSYSDALETFRTMFDLEPKTAQATRVRDLLAIHKPKPLSDKAVDMMVVDSPDGSGAFVIRGTTMTMPSLMGNNPDSEIEPVVDPDKIEMVFIDPEGAEKSLGKMRDFPGIAQRTPIWAPDGSGLALVGSPGGPAGEEIDKFGLYWLGIDGGKIKPVYVTPREGTEIVSIAMVAPSNGGEKFAMMVRITEKPKPVLPDQTASTIPSKTVPDTKQAPTAPTDVPQKVESVAPPPPPAEPRNEIWIIPSANQAPVRLPKLGKMQTLRQLTWVGDKLLALITENKGTDRTFLAEINIGAKKIERIGVPNAVYSSFVAAPDGKRLAVLTADYDYNGDGAIDDKDRHHLAIYSLEKETQAEAGEFTLDFSLTALMQWTSNNRILALDNCWSGSRLLLFDQEARFICSPANGAYVEGIGSIRMLKDGRRAIILDTTQDHNGDGKLTYLDARAGIIDINSAVDHNYVAAIVRRLGEMKSSEKGRD